MYVNTAQQRSLTKQQVVVYCFCNSLNIKEQKVSNKMFLWMLFCYFCKLTIRVKQGKQSVSNFWKTLYKNFVCKTKVKLVNKENISVIEVTITWALGILRVITNNLTNGQSLWAWGCWIQLRVLGCCKLPLHRESKAKL